MSPAVSQLGSILFPLLFLGSSPQRETEMIVAMRTGDTRLAQPPASDRVHRYVELNRIALSGRFRAAASRELQYQAALKGGVKLDEAEKLVVRAGAFTGSGFTGGWDGTLYLKQLYLDAEVLPRTSIQIGGLDIAHGESTEVTSYDFDGYVTGGRFGVGRTNPAFDSLTFTLAHLGELESPSVFHRLGTIGDPNYAQILWMKRFGRVRASAEYTSVEGEPTWRQALRFDRMRFVDVVQFENYERGGDDPGYGFGVYGQRTLPRGMAMGVGFAKIDRNGLNSDRFPRGERIYVTALVPIGRELTLSAFFSQALGETTPTAPRRRLDLALSYDVLDALSGW